MKLKFLAAITLPNGSTYPLVTDAAHKVDQEISKAVDYLVISGQADPLWFQTHVWTIEEITAVH